MKPSVSSTLQVLLLFSCSSSLPNPKLDKHISARMCSSHQSTLHSEIQKDQNFGIEFKFPTLLPLITRYKWTSWWVSQHYRQEVYVVQECAKFWTWLSFSEISTVLGNDTIPVRHSPQQSGLIVQATLEFEPSNTDASDVDSERSLTNSWSLIVVSKATILTSAEWTWPHRINTIHLWYGSFKFSASSLQAVLDGLLLQSDIKELQWKPPRQTAGYDCNIFTKR